MQSLIRLIETILKKEAIKIEQLKSSQNKVYKVTFEKDIYIIKEYSKDSIKNYYELFKRKQQIEISKMFNQNGIKTLIPLSFGNSEFIFFNKKYYLIYEFLSEKNLSSEQLTLKHIKVLAKTQSDIHKCKTNIYLPCFYHKVKIDLNKQLKITKNVDNLLYKIIKDNYITLNEMINNCNKNIKYMKKNMCISHNDYKLLNILWTKDEKDIILLDFDASGLSNPTCSLCESAFTFSNYKNYINYDYYKQYLNTYLENYGSIKENYKDALYVSFNGKLNWLSYMFSKNSNKKDNYIKETIDMIKELVLYYNNIEKFYKIFCDLKEQINF